MLPPIDVYSDERHPQPAFPHTITNEAPIGDGLRDPHGPVLGGGTMQSGQLDDLKNKAASAKVALDGLNVTAAPQVEAASIDAALGKLHQLIALLQQAGALSAGLAVPGGAAGSAGAGRPGPSLASRQTAQYTHAGSNFG